MTDSAPDDQLPALHHEIEDLRTRIDEMNKTDLIRWADSVTEAQHLADLVTAMRQTLSWRITEPLRVVRRRQLGE